MKLEDKNITAFKNEKLSALFEHSMELITTEVVACYSSGCVHVPALVWREAPASSL